MLVLFIILHFSLVVALSIRVLWRQNLSPSARLAWFIILILFPYVSVIIYWMFGEAQLGLEAAEKRKQIIKSLCNKNPKALGDKHKLSAIDKNYQPGFSYAASINGFNATDNNHAELMDDSKSTTKRMIDDFDSATQQIHLLYYIWLNDKTGQAIAHALIRAAKRGVICKAMVDNIGSRPFIKSNLWQEMKDAGVELSIALPIKNLIKVILFSRIDLRNHRKITVIDNRITYCGSQNCADPEFKIKAKYAPWVDIMLRFTGGVVAQNQLLFASDWLIENPSTPISEFFTKPSDNKQGFIAQVFGNGPTERSSSTSQLFSTTLAQAQQRVIISTPYFVPDAMIIDTLCAIAYRGVDVIIILPKKNDSFIVAATSRSYYQKLLDASVKIYEYKGGLLHAKTLTIDGLVSIIGSTNLDLRSFDLNYENNIILYDKKITQAIIERQNSYIANADSVLLAAVKNKPFYLRIWDNIVTTISPIL